MAGDDHKEDTIESKLDGAMRLRVRRKKLAALLSVVPGLGQLWSRRIGAGVFYILLTGLVVLVSLPFFRGEKIPFLALLPVMLFVWIINIYDAYRGVEITPAPCQAHCPLGVNIPLFLSYLARGDSVRARAVIRRKNPFPQICGRVCYHPCERVCQQAALKRAVAIHALERFAAAAGHESSVSRECREGSDPPRAAIIGSGPAGLAAAHFLARFGAKVTIYERLPVAGGMLRSTIPHYRLPEQTCLSILEELEAMGVAFEMGKEWGRDFTLDVLQKEGCKAIFIGTGAWKPVGLGVRGEDLNGVVHCLDLLKSIDLAELKSVEGKRIAVIGGGDAAFDAARSLLRLGAGQVDIIYRRTLSEMPAHRFEVEAAMREGVQIHYLMTPVEIKGEHGKVTALRIVKMLLEEIEGGGRPRPVPILGSEFDLEVDMVVIAVGLQAEGKTPVEEGLATGRQGEIRVISGTYRTNLPGVYAGGDAIRGPSNVTEAIRDGREAAMEMAEALGLRGYMDAKEQPRIDDVVIEPGEMALDGDPVGMPRVDTEERRVDFREVERDLSADEAQAEARRCIRCNRKVFRLS
jgi:NADH-quinone oxidoreductase subunit F